MCFRVLSQLRSFSARTIALAFSGGVLYAILSEVVKPDQVDHESAYLTIAFLLVYMTLFLVGKFRSRSFRTGALMVVVVCLAELVLNTLVTIFTININEHYTTRSIFNEDIPRIRAAVETLEEEDPSFWRMEIVQQKTTNSPSLYGYRGFTIFASTSYEHTARMMRSLGYHGNNINSYMYTSSTSLLDALFGLKYILNKDQPMEDPRLSEVRQDEAGYLYLNEDALPVGYLLSAGIKNWHTEDRNPFKNQEDFLRSAGLQADLYTLLELLPEASKGTNASPYTGSKDIGFSVTRQDDAASMTFEFGLEAEADQHLTLYFDPDGSSTVEFVVNERVGADGQTQEDVRKSTFINEQEMVDLGYRKAGDRIRVIVTVPKDGAHSVRYWGASTNEEVYQKAIAALKQNPLQVERFSGNEISGTLRAERSGVLFLTVPYDPSWSLLVDGQPTEVFAVGGGLMERCFRRRP